MLEAVVGPNVLVTKSWKRRDYKAEDVASGERLLHQSIWLAHSFSFLPAAWWGKCRRRHLGENLFRGTG